MVAHDLIFSSRRDWPGSETGEAPAIRNGRSHLIFSSRRDWPGSEAGETPAIRNGRSHLIFSSLTGLAGERGRGPGHSKWSLTISYSHPDGTGRGARPGRPPLFEMVAHDLIFHPDGTGRGAKPGRPRPFEMVAHDLIFHPDGTGRGARPGRPRPFETVAHDLIFSSLTGLAGERGRMASSIRNGRSRLLIFIPRYKPPVHAQPVGMTLLQSSRLSDSFKYLTTRTQRPSRATRA